jgi:signal peptidase I
MQSASENMSNHKNKAGDQLTACAETTLQPRSNSTRSSVANKVAKNNNLQSSQALRTELLSLLLKIALIVVSTLMLFTFVFGISRYQEAAMFPAIKDGDLVIYYRYTSDRYLPRDVVALKLNGEIQFRRVVATAGDTVDINEYGLVINGAPQQESAITGTTVRYEEGVEFPLVVPEGQVFVLGDNRPESIDSRIYGCVEIKDILGKVMMIIRKRGI